jgi:hypothetical protein
MHRAALIAVALLTASCGADPAPRAPTAVAIAPAAPAPTASASASAPAPIASAPPPRPCPPRPAYAPVSFVTGRMERKGATFNVFTGAPRLATRDPELAPSLGEAQTAIDKWMDDKVAFCHGGAGNQCSAQAYCELTRNDGEYLAFLCTAIVWAQGALDEVQHEALLFRRRGKRFERIAPADLARDRAADLRFVLFPAEAPDVAHESYLALRDDAFELSLNRVHLPPPSVMRTYRRYADAAPHLACDTVLALPEPPREGAIVEPGPLVIATHVTGDTRDDQVSGDELGAGFVYPRFIAHEPSQAAAARLLNETAERFVAAHRDPTLSSTTAACRAYTSTPRFVSMICIGEGNYTHLAPAAQNLVLGDPPKRIGAAELFAHRPSAPRDIARRCFDRYLPGRRNPNGLQLPKVPALRAADLESFALWQTGATFAIPFEVAGERHVELCFVPNQVLGTSVEMLARSAGK